MQLSLPVRVGPYGMRCDVPGSKVAGPDEGCIGDLVVGEAFMSGIAGTVCWGTHRDTAAILAFGARVQAVRLLKGELLRTQLDLDRYVARRNSDPNYTFREHLKTFGGAIEI